MQPDTITTKEQARAAISLVQSVLAEEGRKVDGAITFDDARTANEILKARKTLRENEQAERLWMQRDFSWQSVAEKLESAYQWITSGGSCPPWVVVSERLS